MKNKCKCLDCPHFKFKEKYDAHYCKRRNIWLELSCEDEDCYFECTKRPERPLNKEVSSTLPEDEVKK